MFRKRRSTKKRQGLKYQYQGALLSPPDSRDYLLSRTAAPVPIAPLKFLPLTPVLNQANTNSCVSFAVCTGYAKARIISGRDTEIFDPAEAFTYYKARELSGLESDDRGSYLRDGLKSGQQHGFVSEHFWPFSVGTINLRPNWLSHILARGLRIKEYYRLSSVEEMRRALSNNLPVVVTLSLPDSFFAYSGGVYSSTKKGLYYHAMAVQGYDRDYVLLQNSWGTGWGEQGLCRVSNASFELLCEEAWAIRAI
jgi:hypothetical protein